ncbi:hypothetical protein [Lapidilactobacillus gannanensis]|uniref:Uncharacterized protein n=1 Tax=Lapidilactobacillus gannanensis TaxID=2486002 RepID=A0ABW4BLX0_9LACO|nr:hypothetical protein [Lapidilactobacillus gannanensis]
MKRDEVNPHTPFHVIGDNSILRATFDHSGNIKFEIWFCPENFWVVSPESTNRHIGIAVEKRGIAYYKDGELLEQMTSRYENNESLKQVRVESYRELVKSLSSNVEHGEIAKLEAEK